jgi:hypothetical protein
MQDATGSASVHRDFSVPVLVSRRSPTNSLCRVPVPRVNSSASAAAVPLAQPEPQAASASEPASASGSAGPATAAGHPGPPSLPVCDCRLRRWRDSESELWQGADRKPTP